MIEAVADVTRQSGELEDRWPCATGQRGFEINLDSCRQRAHLFPVFARPGLEMHDERFTWRQQGRPERLRTQIEAILWQQRGRMQGDAILAAVVDEDPPLCFGGRLALGRQLQIPSRLQGWPGSAAGQQWQGQGRA